MGVFLNKAVRAPAQLGQHVAQELQVVAQRGAASKGHAERAAAGIDITWSGVIMGMLRQTQAQ